ncbi:hypothetical protein DENIS_3461 [Desulfonema ishimotonii]|uniref:Uncharacterized protein n=1 Tax=Desulfonema ishimotonii TaxID=45657 RepID=A0A401FZT2_9BACT|nr:hypothetical protein [Desulfonema ishimotonii]GBC62489.1 hypothetical protein DENIS_3461 [Desulfonema ishimotonii]
MNYLIPKIRARLQAQLAYIRPTDISPSPHEDFVPNGAMFPLVGIKDGPVDVDRLMGGVSECQAEVLCSVMTQIQSGPEATLMGVGDRKGLFEVCADVRTALQDWLPEITDRLIIDAFVVRIAPSRLLMPGNGIIQARTLTFRYLWEENI